MRRVLFSSLSPHWATPSAVYLVLDAEFHFTLDPCPLHGENGDLPLLTSWTGERVFCNPPYSPRGIVPFLARATEADVAVFLLPARTDTKWFHDSVLPKAKEIRFVRGRLKFGEAKNAAPFPSMIIVFQRE